MAKLNIESINPLTNREKKWIGNIKTEYLTKEEIEEIYGDLLTDKEKTILKIKK